MFSFKFYLKDMLILPGDLMLIEIVCNIRNLIKNQLINYLVNLATYLKIDD